MPNFVAQNASELAFGCQLSIQRGRNEHLAAWQRKSIDGSVVGQQVKIECVSIGICTTVLLQPRFQRVEQPESHLIDMILRFATRVQISMLCAIFGAAASPIWISCLASIATRCFSPVTGFVCPIEKYENREKRQSPRRSASAASNRRRLRDDAVGDSHNSFSLLQEAVNSGVQLSHAQSPWQSPPPPTVAGQAANQGQAATGQFTNRLGAVETGRYNLTRILLDLSVARDAMEQTLQLLNTLQSNHIVEILVVLAALLIVIDYFFPVDVPAHVGYLCLGLAAFFAFPASIGASFVVGLLTWFFFATGHRLLVGSVLGKRRGYVSECYATSILRWRHSSSGTWVKQCLNVLSLVFAQCLTQLVAASGVPQADSVVATGR